jgi:mono/diheme cytochrome c family protein
LRQLDDDPRLVLADEPNRRPVAPRDPAAKRVDHLAADKRRAGASLARAWPGVRDDEADGAAGRLQLRDHGHGGLDRGGDQENRKREHAACIHSAVVRRRAALFVPLVALTLALAGCGGGEEATPTPETVTGPLPANTEAATTEEQAGGGGVEGDAEAGKQIFADQGCGSCHTLEAAASTGNVGPNLDDLKPEYDAVVAQVTNGGGAMPAFKDSLSEEQIQDVSAFVFTSTHS